MGKTYSFGKVLPHLVFEYFANGRSKKKRLNFSYQVRIKLFDLLVFNIVCDYNFFDSGFFGVARFWDFSDFIFF